MTMIRKETILKFLSNICLLLPGNIKARKGWYLSWFSIFSLIGLALTVASCAFEFISHTKFADERKTKEIFRLIKRVPVRPIAACLKLPSGRSGISVDSLNETVPLNFVSPQNVTQQPDPDQPSFLENIVSTTDRILSFVVNISVRLFFWISFPVMIALFLKLFGAKQDNEQSSAPGPQKNGVLVRLWKENVQVWSSTEKTFLLAIVLSQIQREMEFFFIFYSSIRDVEMDFIDLRCIIFQIAMEQGRVVVTRGLVVEVATLFLLMVMTTFINMIGTVAGKEDTKSDYFKGGELETNLKQSEKNPPVHLFVKTHDMLLKSELKMGTRVLPNKIASIQDHISEIVGTAHDYDEGTRSQEPSLVFRLSQKSRQNKYPAVSEVEKETGKEIYSKINYIITMYFELMSTWEECSQFTGFITLFLFSQLTFTFCFNTYLTLDATMTFGLFSGLGITGILRGIVIVAKLICVCDTAQTLKDMTPILLDRILKLKLRLLSLPTESFVGGNFSEVESDNGYTADQTRIECERCRGLGSFLSEMVSYIRGHPFELSAWGYFTVSRSTLTTITGVIVTYLVVLVQFQSYANSSKP